MVPAVVFTEDAGGRFLALWCTEELDEGFALCHLLLCESERCACLGEAQGKAAAGALDHRAVPLVRVEPLAGGEDALAAQVVAEADALEGCVMCSLAIFRILQGRDEPVGQLLSLGEVHDLRGLVVSGVGHEEDFKLRAGGVFVEPCICDWLRAVGLDVYVQCLHLARWLIARGRSPGH